MSVTSTSANYGGKVCDIQQNVKQFFVSSSSAQWVYKKIKDGITVQTPASSKINVLIESDLIVTGSIYNTSDERLKANINKISDESTDKLFTLNPITFSYINNNLKKHYGVSAQEVEGVFPELVENNNIFGYKTVNYQEFIPLMLAKIKKMQSEIDELNQKLCL
jgi:alpha-mannosidase